MSTNDSSSKVGAKLDGLLSKNHYDVRYWDATKGDFVYPEVGDSELQYAPIAGKTDRGICFSGGGTVSVSVIAGFLDALQELGLLDTIGYVSGVSGGTWGTAPFMYYPGDDDSALLGSHQLPAAITEADIATTTPGTLADTACNAPIADLTLGFAAQGVGYHEFQAAVGQIFLQPAGINSPRTELEWKNKLPTFKSLQKRRSFYTTDEDAANSIVARNKDMQSSDFMTLKKGRPYYIMNTTMLVPRWDGDTDPYVYPFEFTPLYSGMRQVQPAGHEHRKQRIGGVYVESYGFNSEANDAPKDGKLKASNNYRMELCQPVGTSGSALEKKLQAWDARFLTVFFPNFRYWNPETSDKTPETFRYDFGDGGIIENSGVTPLLARGVKYIGMFLSEGTYYFKNGDPEAVIDIASIGWEQIAFGYNQIAILFGGLLIDTHSMKNKRKQHEPEQRIPVEWVKDSQPRQVFQNQLDGGTALDGVIAQLAAKREAGDPSSVNLVLKVLPNALFGIAGGYDAYVKLTNVAECSQWADALQDGIKSQLGTGELTDFPNVQVFKQNKDHLIQLTPKQANLLGDLAYWMVKTEAADYQKVLNGQPFS